MDQLVNKLSAYSGEDLIKIQKALYLAEEKDVDSLNVLKLIFPLHPDADTVISVLVQRLFDQDLISRDEIIEQFGFSVLSVVTAVRALENLNYAENDRVAKIESLRKMFLAMAKDLRVVIVLLAFRLQRMRTYIDTLEIRDQEMFARETMDLYVPIASRLGMYRMKTQLEDLSFKYFKPEDYKDFTDQLKKIQEGCNISISVIKKRLERFFKERGVKAGVYGRIKSIYSIYKKLKRKSLNNVSELYDVFAIRVILPVQYDENGEQSVDYLYTVLGMIHSEWRPVSRKSP